jgi:hypothetical protein
MSAVGKAIGGVTGFLSGGKGIPQKNEGQAISAADQARQDQVGGSLEDLLNSYTKGPSSFSNQQSSNQDVQDLFRQHLTDFIAADHGPNPTPEQLAQATSFVDQTFTKPMQNQIDQYNSRFQDSQNAQAAALGRAPGSDQATQQAVYTSGLQNLYNLQAQRGSQIQQQALGLNQQNFANQNQALQTGAAGSNYLNNLVQQALSNRVGLLNGLTGINQFNQTDRLSNRTLSGGGTTSGLLTNINSVQNGISNVAAGGSQNYQSGQQLLGSFGKAGGMAMGV